MAQKNDVFLITACDVIITLKQIQIIREFHQVKCTEFKGF